MGFNGRRLMYISVIHLEGHTGNWSLVAPMEENPLVWRTEMEIHTLFHLNFVMSLSVTETIVKH